MNPDNSSTFCDTSLDGSPNKRARFCSTIRGDLQPLAEEEDNQDHPVFRIELIVEPIMENLSRQDRLECRKVNSSLNYIATHYLQNHTPMSFNFEYDQMKKTYLLSRRKNSDTSKFPLEVLSSILSTSWNFPVRSFKFKNGKLNVDSLQNFLTVYGKNIRKLSIHVFYSPKPNQYETPVDYPPLSLLKKLLTTQAPFLESLKLTDFPRIWSYKMRNKLGKVHKDSNTHLKPLPNLKYLKLSGWNEHSFLVENILKVAPNLEKVITNIQRSVVAAKKFHLLKEYCFSEMLSKKSDDVSGLLISGGKPHLEGIAIVLYRVMSHPETTLTTALALQKILETNAPTLKFVKFRSPTDIPAINVHFKFPRLSKVTLITITTPHPISLKDNAIRDLSNQYFPPGFQFHETFPNLNKIVFNMDKLGKSIMWEKHFCLYEPVLTVKSLVFQESKYIPPDAMWFCSQIFPELNYLEIHTKCFDFYSAARSGMFQFSHMKELRVDIYLDIHSFYGNIFPILDASLTGFDPQGVLTLYNHYSEPNTGFHTIDTESRDYYRAFQIEEYSILNLKELEKLNITFVDQSAEAKEGYPLILSDVVRVFAFLNCPNLQLRIYFNVSNEENVKKIKNAVSLNFGI